MRKAGGDPESVWRFAPFMRLWFARVAASAGVQMFAVATGWRMYEITHDVFDLGMVGLMQFLPRVLLVLVVGTAVDRFDRRMILAASLALQGAMAIILAIGAAPFGFGDGRLLIYGLSLGVGVAQAFTMPAMQALLPNVVPVKMLPKAISAGATGMQGAIIVAPALAGLLYAIPKYGAFIACASAAACFMLGAGPVLRVPLTAGRRIVKERVTLESIFAGMRFLRSRPDILGAVSLDLFAVLLGGATALLPPYAEQVLHTGSAGLGLLRSAPAVGALAVSIALARRPPTRRIGAKMFGAVAVFGAATGVFGLSTSLPLSLAVLVVLGAADMVSVVIRSSFVQIETPDAMRGRVSAVNSLFIGASNELGEFESGMVSSLVGVVPGIVLGGVGTLAVTLVWLRLFPSLAKRDRMSPAA